MTDLTPEQKIVYGLEVQRRRSRGTRRLMLGWIERYLCWAWRDR